MDAVIEVVWEDRQTSGDANTGRREIARRDPL